MKPIDPDIGSARACVIDGDLASRAELTSALKRFGVGHVDQLQRPTDAARVLPALQYDIVLCDSSFADDPMTGQQLIDQLRQAQQLPLSTIVILISSDAGYAQVAEAAEAALDAYLIRPYTREALRHKLQEARRRKRLLQPILDRVENKAFAEAAQLCTALYEAKTEGWVQAARIGAELLLQLGDAQAAMRLQEAVLATKALPWARTGITPAPPGEAGAPAASRRTLESLLAQQPGQSDAYDLMCRTLLEQGHSQDALAAMRRAAQLTPGSVPRLQKLGVLAFYYGDPTEATDALQQATDIGLSAKQYDLQGLVLLATLQFDRRQTRPLAQLHSSFGRILASVPGSARLVRFGAVLDTLRLLSLGRMADAVAQVRQMLEAVHDPLFDFEAACNALMLAARLAREDHPMEDIDASLTRLARRFAVSKASTELLASAARLEADVVGTIREGHSHIGKLAEQGVTLSVQRKPQAAVEALLAGSEETLNRRLLDLAEHTLQRHHAAIREADALQHRIDELRSRYHSYGAQLRLATPGGP
ncbi:response regulator [Ideonella sp. BN130291]|uniref:response regulator n=1 Tax=Ideonella sp. BN130291 TaxID=3112940 RepID=UPI002E26CC66|nr:response regulator [Ideonella sp. BN130291]